MQPELQSCTTIVALETATARVESDGAGSSSSPAAGALERTSSTEPAGLSSCPTPGSSSSDIEPGSSEADASESSSSTSDSDAGPSKSDSPVAAVNSYSSDPCPAVHDSSKSPNGPEAAPSLPALSEADTSYQMHHAPVNVDEVSFPK